MNYVPKHSQDHADSEYYHTWVDRKGPRLYTQILFILYVTVRDLN